MISIRSVCGRKTKVVEFLSLNHLWRYTSTESGRACPADVRVEESVQHGVKPFSDIPGPKGLPYVGILPYFSIGSKLGLAYKVEDFHYYLKSCYQRYGDVFRITINGSTTVHLFNPDLVQKVYQNVGKMPGIVPLLETTQMYRKYRDMSPGLGNTNGEEWYRMRTAVQQIMMVPRTVPAFLPQVNEIANEFIDQRIEKQRNKQIGVVSKIANEIAKWNLESSGMTCFEKRLGCLTAEAEDDSSWQQQMINANSNIFSLSTRMYFSLPWHYIISTPTWKNIIKAEDFFFGNGQRLVDETCTRIRKIDQSSETSETNSDDQQSQRTDRRGEGWTFLRYLLNKCDQTGETFSYKDLSIITLSLFADGLSTTTPSMVGQLYCLAKNTDKQNKLYQEIQQIAPDPNLPITDDMLQQATYLKSCIKEGFRAFLLLVKGAFFLVVTDKKQKCSEIKQIQKFTNRDMVEQVLSRWNFQMYTPEVRMATCLLRAQIYKLSTDVSRILDKDIELGGYLVPAGTPLSLNNNLLLQDERHVTQPELYLPERWSRETKGRHLHPYLLLPFGHGTRMCAGMRLAEQEMRVLIIKLLQRYRLELSPDEPELRQVYKMLLRPRHDPAIRFIPRTQNDPSKRS